MCVLASKTMQRRQWMTRLRSAGTTPCVNLIGQMQRQMQTAGSSWRGQDVHPQDPCGLYLINVLISLGSYPGG